ncbi:MAG: sigma-54-dependent Fis family transcriptional regulator [Candidatus Riflebacteria bacterium]|nr:sigma-54-dependent Fis family transcriptional regulator [Candidatus Riflebacteria bacterium]
MPPAEPRASLLVVDDDPAIREALVQQLSLFGYRVTACPSAEDALAHPGLATTDCLVVDVRMEGMDGIEFLKLLQQKGCDQPVIVMTGHGTITLAVEAMKAGAYDFLEKPLEMEILRFTLQRAVAHRQLTREKDSLQERVTELLGQETGFHGLIGRSAPMQDLFRQIATFAPTHSPVLIIGETGTGQELAAQALHRLSLQHDQPFLAVNMGGLPDTLSDSELFGHVKGAFTGAFESRKGCFEQAATGTIFLDEVAGLSPAIQAKLLRVLETGEFRRVGGEKTLHAQARILAATNRPLEELVRQGGFREDLFYRLNVLRLDLPPLRDRPEDIPLLAGHFLDFYAKIHARSRPTLGAEAVSALQADLWPGNVRELRYEMERLVVAGSRQVRAWKAPSRPETPSPALGLREKVEALERQEITKAMTACGGNIGQAARLLGLPRTVLYDRLKKFRLLPPPDTTT